MSRATVLLRRLVIPLTAASVAFTLSAAPGALGDTPAGTEAPRAEAYDTIELQARTNVPSNDDGWNLPPGSSFNSMTADINDEGQIAFNALIAAEGSISDLAPGIWFGGGGVGEVVHRGQDGQSISTVSVNDSADIAFTVGEGSTANQLYRYDADAGSAAHVDTAPVLPNSYSQLGLDEEGNIGFQASLSSGRALAAVRDGEGVFYLRDNSSDPDSNVGWIYSPAANDTGQIASKVGLTSGTSSDIEINIYEPDGSHETVLSTQSLDPDSPYSGFDNSLGLSDNGYVAVPATRAADGTKVIVRTDGTTTEEVAVVGEDGLQSLAFFAPDVNDAGQVVFRGTDADGDAVFVADGASLVRVAGNGDVVETDLGTAQLGQHDASPVFGGAPRINNRGDVSFNAGVHPEGDNLTEWGSGVFIAYGLAEEEPEPPVDPEPVETIELQARGNLLVNDEGWNLPPGSTFNSTTPDINDAAQVAFRVQLVGAEDNPFDLAPGVWLGGGGEGEIVYRGANHQMISDVSLNEWTDIAFPLSEGSVQNVLYRYDAASGTASQVDTLPVLPNSYSHLGLDDEGNIGFQATLSNGRALAAVRDGVGVFYVRDNSSDPTSDVGYIYSPSANDTGQIAGKVGLPTDISNDLEIRIYEPDGTHQTVLSSQSVDPDSPYSAFENSLGLSDNGFVTVQATRAADNVKVVVRTDGTTTDEVAVVGEDGLQALAFFAPDVNDAGQVVFRGDDADGQAVFVADGDTLERVAGNGDVVETDRGLARLGQHDNSPVFGGAPRINTGGDVSFTAGVHPHDDNQVEWGTGVFVAYGEEGDEPPVEPEHPETVERLSGENRFATAANAALKVYPDGADTVYVTTGRNFPDALTASAPAGHAGAPILLSDTDRLPKATVGALEGLDPTNIILVGGSGSVSDDVFEALSEHADTVRIGGTHRYQTAADLARTFEQTDAVYVATGEGYADALSAGARAGAEGVPVLLVKQDEVPGATTRVLAELQPSQVYVVGGEASVAEEVLEQLGETSEVTRISGGDRYGTAAALSAPLQESEFGFVSTGLDWPDALSSSALAAHLGAPLHLVQESSVPSTTVAELERIQPPHVRVVGGSGVVQDGVLELLAGLEYTN